MTTEEELALVSAVVSVTQQAISWLEGARSGTVSPQTALGNLGAMQAAITANDAEEDAAEAKKFPTP